MSIYIKELTKARFEGGGNVNSRNGYGMGITCSVKRGEFPTTNYISSDTYFVKLIKCKSCRNSVFWKLRELDAKAGCELAKLLLSCKGGIGNM